MFSADRKNAPLFLHVDILLRLRESGGVAFSTNDVCICISGTLRSSRLRLSPLQQEHLFSSLSFLKISIDC